MSDLFDDDDYGLRDMRPATSPPHRDHITATDDGQRDRQRDERATGATERDDDEDRLLEIEMGRGGPCP